MFHFFFFSSFHYLSAFVFHVGNLSFDFHSVSVVHVIWDDFCHFAIDSDFLLLVFVSLFLFVSPSLWHSLLFFLSSSLLFSMLISASLCLTLPNSAALYFILRRSFIIIDSKSWFEWIGHWFDWDSMSKIWFDLFDKHSTQCTQHQHQHQHQHTRCQGEERDQDRLLRVVHVCVQVVGIRRSRETPNDKLNETWHVYNFSFYEAKKTRPRRGKKKGSRTNEWTNELNHHQFEM